MSENDEVIVGLPPGSKGFEPISISGLEENAENKKRNGIDWMREVVETGRKTNENIEYVNRVGGGILYEGYNLKRFKGLLSQQKDVDIEEGARARVGVIVDDLMLQNLLTGYDTVLVSERLSDLEKIALEIEENLGHKEPLSEQGNS